jgi:hypothetical protein
MVDDSRIFKFHPDIQNRLTTRESNWLEFKESFNWGSKDSYGKTAAGFANNKGGVMVFGVKNNPRELVGLQNDNFENLDEAKIAEYFNGIFVPELIFSKKVLRINGKTIGILEINGSARKPVISTKNDGEIKESEIYYRYNARTDRIKYPELKALMDLEKEEIENKWRSLLKNIGRIPDIANAVILNDVKGMPVRFTSDPTAPAYRVSEDPTIGGYSLRYQDIITEMHGKFKNFKANNKFVALMKKLRRNEKFCRERYLNPNNPKSMMTRFYHPRILTELKKFYK